MLFFDPLYLLFTVPALLLGIWAQSKVSSAFDKYSQIGTKTGFSGAQAARKILDYNGLQNVQVERVDGFLSDHYDPNHKVLRLSSAVYDRPSLSAVGVAAHEAGHALQDQQNYSPLKFRSAIVPAVQIGSSLGPIVFFAGLFMTRFVGTSVAWIGIILFGLSAVFALVTLPVEYDASSRAKQLLVNAGIVNNSEVQGATAVLDAAALTYVAAAIQSISTLLYYVYILVGRRN
jgi:uncharacterized protein